MSFLLNCSFVLFSSPFSALTLSLTSPVILSWTSKSSKSCVLLVWSPVPIDLVLFPLLCVQVLCFFVFLSVLIGTDSVIADACCFCLDVSTDLPISSSGEKQITSVTHYIQKQSSKDLQILLCKAFDRHRYKEQSFLKFYLRKPWLFMLMVFRVISKSHDRNQMKGCHHTQISQKKCTSAMTSLSTTKFLLSSYKSCLYKNKVDTLDGPSSKGT